MIDFQQIGN